VHPRRRTNDIDTADLAGPSRPAWRSVVRFLLIVALVGYFVVRYAVRQYFRKELAWEVDGDGS
jgi:hypothetical protein